MKEKIKSLLKNNEFLKALKDVAVAVVAMVSLAISLTSCGVTKATIQRPAEGTVTTVTITTNNPITTNTTPNVNLK